MWGHAKGEALGVCEVNAYLGLRYFKKYDKLQMDYRKEVAHGLIHNLYETKAENEVSSEGVCSRASSKPAKHEKVLVCKPFSVWQDGRWEKVFKPRYQQRYYVHDKRI